MNTKRQRFLVLAIAILSVAVLWIVLWVAREPGAAGDYGGPGSVPSTGPDEAVEPVEAPAGRQEDRAPLLDLKLELDTLSRLEDGGGQRSVLLRHLGAGEVGATIEIQNVHGEPMPNGTVRFVAGPSARRLFRADAQGVVSVSGVVAAKHLIEISCPPTADQRTSSPKDGGAAAPTSLQRFINLDREEDRHLVIRWGPTATVWGNICDEENRSLAGIEVTASGRTAQTDETGGYRIEGILAADATPLRVSAEGFITSEVAVDLQGGFPLRYHFVLARAGSITGRVLVPPEDVAHTRLYLMPVAMGRNTRELAFPFHLRGVYADVPINSDGTFELDGLPVPATMQIVLRHPRYTMTPVPFSVRTPGVQREKLILAPERAPVVSGRVRSAGGGAPIAGAVVECRPEGPRSTRAQLVPFPPETLGAHVIPLEILDLEWTETVSDAKGLYSLPRRLGSGAMLLSAVADGYSPASVRIAGGSRFLRDLELVPLAGDGEAVGAASLLLSFDTSEKPKPLLRITLFREGRQESTPFLWESGKPYQIRFPVPSRIRLAATFQQERRLLASTESEVIVRGEVTRVIAVPPR